MEKKIKNLLILGGLLVFLIMPYFVFAQPSPEELLIQVGEEGAGFTAYEERTFDRVIGDVIRVFLSLLGIIFIILMLYAGYNWMTAAGEEEKVNKAKSTIKQSIIGLIIVAGSYAIWWFIATALL